MATTTSNKEPVSETSILARLMCEGLEPVHADIARYLLDLNFPEEDKARMHDLAVRKQSGNLSTANAMNWLRTRRLEPCS
jgi:hypothetical protein